MECTCVERLVADREHSIVIHMQGVNDAPAHGTALLHVVYVWPYLEWGGAQRYFIALMRRVAGRARVTAIVPVGSDSDLVAELRALGATVEFMRGRLDVTPATTVVHRFTAHLRAWHAQYAMWVSCRRVAGPGTVFHCDVSLTLFTAILWALAGRHGVVVTLHTSLPDESRIGGARANVWRRRLRSLIGRRGFRIVAANKHVRESLRPFLPDADLAQVPLAYSPVERAEVVAAGAGTARDETRRRLGIAPGRFLVVTGAQFIERKGCWVWIDAARLVRAAAADVDFLWLGPAPVTGRAASELRGLDGVVRYLPQADLPDGRRSYFEAVAAADLFVLPSLEEGLPLALVEAMALGVPVISTPVNAIPEAVVHGVTGLLVAPGDAQGLAAAILQLHHDRELAVRLAARGEAHARIFDADEMAAVTFAVYESCVGATARTFRSARNSHLLAKRR
jgi:glycosyltransferase involved in cell wall biosynthesis